VVYHRKGEYAILAIGKGQLGLVSRPVPTHVEIDVPDPDALYEQLKEAGLPVTEPPEAKGWATIRLLCTTLMETAWSLAARAM
jgi:uncharacterized glyoxalase superfamily protein PhnB